MSRPAQRGGWEDSGAGVTGLVSIPDQSGCQTALLQPWGCSSGASSGHGSSRVSAPNTSLGSLQSKAGPRRGGSPDEGPYAGTRAVESQRGIKASRKEYVPALGPAVGQPGQPAEQQYSYCALGASARPSGRTEVLYVSLQPCVHGVSARHRPRHNRVLQAGLQGSSVLAEKLLSWSLSFAVPSCP